MMNQSHKSICSYYARTVVVMRKKKKKKNKHKKHHDFYKKISGGENRELTTMFYIRVKVTSTCSMRLLTPFFVFHASTKNNKIRKEHPLLRLLSISLSLSSSSYIQ